MLILLFESSNIYVTRHLNSVTQATDAVSSFFVRSVIWMLPRLLHMIVLAISNNSGCDVQSAEVTGKISA